jgi:hypothetical protein
MAPVIEKELGRTNSAPEPQRIAAAAGPGSGKALDAARNYRPQHGGAMAYGRLLRNGNLLTRARPFRAQSQQFSGHPGNVGLPMKIKARRGEADGRSIGN